MDKRLEQVMAQETVQKRDQELRRTYVLSQRSQGIVMVLSLFIAGGTYFYTRRWKALGFFLGWCVCLGVVFAGEEEWEPAPAAAILAALWAGVDNCVAINKARERIALLQAEASEPSREGE